MKKNNLFKIATLSCLSAVTIVMYLSKLESIVLSVDIPSYFVFASMVTICGLLLYSYSDIKNWANMISNKTDDKKEIPEIIYNFCKNYYFNTDDKTVKFVKNNVKDKSLANFFVRYIDKNNQEEIEEYIKMQEIAIEEKAENAHRVINFNNMFIAIGVAAAYIYDSNIKGILLIGGALSLYNLISSKNIKSNIDTSRKMIELYKSVYNDILNHRNAKYIMYKSKAILGIDDEYVTIDNVVSDYSLEDTVTNEDVENTEVVKTPSIINIEKRISSLITIGRNKNKNKKPKRINN